MTRTERTRSALQAAALELFHELGYDATATAVIARRAGVSEMTLFRHFPTKESLIIDDPFDPLIAEAVRARPADEHAMTATMRGIADTWRDVSPPDAGAARERLRIVAATPSLRGAITRGSAATETAIASALVDRGESPGTASIVAAAVIAGLNAALLQWSATGGPDLGEAMTTAFTALEGGAGA